MAQIRAAILTNFDEVARFVGLDPGALLRTAGLDARSLADAERMLPLIAVADLLEDAARQSGCEQFGLLMAESRSLGSIGPVSLLLAHEPRVGDVIAAMVRHQRLFGDAFQIECAAIEEAMVVRIELACANPTRQGADLALFCRCLAAILGRRWAPESIHFIHSKPADLRIHRRIFGCPVDFDSDFNGFVCTRNALRERNPAGDKELAAHAERLLALILPPPGMASASERVRRTLRLLLPERRGTIEQVARSLHLTPRSLQRKLHREGQGFGTLLDEIRGELARKYLSTSQHVNAVAHMAGYQSASSFTRWFKAQFGMSPIEWRQQAAGEERPTKRNAVGLSR